jgi:hypothetical protein
MTCEQFQDLLPEMGGNNRNIEYETHLRSCQSCWGLVADLSAISRQAHSLRASEEPSPQIWNSIEAALRSEGLIRPEQEQQPVLVLKRRSRWRTAWILPAVATLLVVFGIVNYRDTHPSATKLVEVAPPSVANVQSPVNMAVSPEDQKFLTAVSFRSPALREKYEQGLRDVNAYIRDAQQSAQSNPNDEDLQRYLMNAYDQKATLYEMALDRSQ